MSDPLIARDVTVQLPDGTNFTARNVPPEVSYDDVLDRAKQMYTPPVGRDMAKAAQAGVVQGAASIPQSINRAVSSIPVAGPAIQGTADWVNKHLFGMTPDEMIQKISGSLGGNYQPQTTAGQFTKPAVAGMTGTALTGGVSPAALLQGAGSGLLGQAAKNANLGQGGEMLASALPFLGPALAKGTFNPGGTEYAGAREALARTEDQLRAQPRGAPSPQQVEQAAQQNSIPLMGWQNYPPSSAIFKKGAQASTLAGAEPMQQQLRDQAVALANMQRLRGSSAGQAATQSASTSQGLQDVDILQGSPHGGQHEMGTLAALSEMLGEHVPVLRQAIPLGGFARMVRERLFSGPSVTARQEVYGAPTIEQMTQAAQKSPRQQALMDAIRAYVAPNAAGFVPPELQPGNSK